MTPLRLVAMGDSISEGQYLPPECAWPMLLDGDYIVHNAGVSNDTTRMMLERFPRDVQALLPDVVVLQAGHNDCNRWQTDRYLPRVSPLAFQANLSEMVERVRKFDAIPLLCNIVPTRKNEQYDREAEIYSIMVGTVADWLNVPIIDVRSVFLKNENWADELLLDDGLHLSEAGSRLYARVVQRRLDEEVRQ